MLNGGNSLKTFSGFRLDIANKFLWHLQEPVDLPPKAMELLCVLAEKQGELVTKEEIWNRVWSDTFVEETNLTHNIYLLRKTFTHYGEANMIQTVPRRGYRFFVKNASGTNGEAAMVVERHIFGSANKEIDSIAVLPLANESGDASMDYLSEGIAESLIDNLSLLPRLRVIGRMTAFRFKPADSANIQQIAAELDVQAIVTGRVRLTKSKVSVKIELVRTSDAVQLWGDQYQRELHDLLEMQTEIANEISHNLRLNLTKRETRHFPRPDTVNPEAHQFYLKGRYFWNKRTPEWMKKGVECFQQALDWDPNYALAYSGLADSYISFAMVGALSPATAIPTAKAAAERALEINERLAEPHAALAFIKSNYDWDWTGAVKHFERAAEINPNYSIGFHWHGFCLTARRQYSKALEVLKRAKNLDPLSPIISTVCGFPYYCMRQPEQAIRIYREVVETNTSFFPVRVYLGMAYQQNGQYEEAAAESIRALTLTPDNTFALASLGYIYAVSGNDVKAREILDDLHLVAGERYVSPYFTAEIYAGLGDIDEALTHLEKSIEERSWWGTFADVNPRFDNLRSEPRFRNILKRMKLGDLIDS